MLAASLAFSTKIASITLADPLNPTKKVLYQTTVTSSAVEHGIADLRIA
jgi:hypothetical protein